MRTRFRLFLFLVIVVLAGGFGYWRFRPAAGDGGVWTKIADSPEFPTSMTDMGDNRFLISRLNGEIVLMDDNSINPTPVLDLTEEVIDEGGEQGMFRVIADPNFADNGYIYVHYTAQPDGHTRVERYTMSGDTIDEETMALVYETEQFNALHNGGSLEFDQDGYLYIGLGDRIARELVQDLSSPHGKILRIDVSDLPYTIPEDNPFVDVEGALPEIFLIGMRNPWRFSFDRETGDLFIGDIGDAHW